MSYFLSLCVYVEIGLFSHKNILYNERNGDIYKKVLCVLSFLLDIMLLPLTVLCLYLWSIVSGIYWSISFKQNIFKGLGQSIIDATYILTVYVIHGFEIHKDRILEES